MRFQSPTFPLRPLAHYAAHIEAPANGLTYGRVMKSAWGQVQQGRGCEGLSPPPQLLHAHLPTVQAHSPPVVEGAFVNTAPAAGGKGASTPVLKLKKKGNGIKKQSWKL